MGTWGKCRYPPQVLLVFDSDEDSIELINSFRFLQDFSELSDDASDAFDVHVVAVQKKQPFDIRSIAVAPGHR